MKIIEEIIENEKTKWLKELLTDIKEGWKEYKIVIQFPIERSKYYQIKERFLNKIYKYCIYRRLVEHQDEEGKQFEYGERVAYTECIEWIEGWEKSKERGLNFNIEEKYPLEKF